MPARRQISAIDAASVVRQGDAGRVVEVRDRVQQLDPAAGGLTGVDRGDERLRDQAVVVHRDVHDLRLVRLEGAQRADVGRRLRQDDVTRIDEDPGGQVQRHLRTDGDHHVVGMRLDPLQRHHLADLLAQSGMPWPDPYCSATRPSSATSAAASAASDSSGSDLQVRHPAGQRHHLGPVGDGEQCPDRRCPHPAVRCAYRWMCWSRLLPVIGTPRGGRRFVRCRRSSSRWCAWPGRRIGRASS